MTAIAGMTIGTTKRVRSQYCRRGEHSTWGKVGQSGTTTGDDDDEARLPRARRSAMSGGDVTAVVRGLETGSLPRTDSRQQICLGQQRLVPRVIVKGGRECY